MASPDAAGPNWSQVLRRSVDRLGRLAWDHAYPCEVGEAPVEAAVLGAPRAPSVRNPLRRIEWVLDESSLSQSHRAQGARIAVGTLFVIFGTVALVLGVKQDAVTLTPLMFIVGAIPIFMNRFGRFGRFFVPVVLGLFAYKFLSEYVIRYKLGVHYTPQIRIEEALTPGSSVPSVWLQEHLYHGRTGPLEVFSVVAYISHFIVPFVVAAVLAIYGRSREFKLMMFAILTVFVLAAITFLVAPTAPPWLAARHGYLTGVHHILKQSMYDSHMSSLAAIEGDGTKYDLTAAVPSLHAAFPLIVSVR